LDCTDDWNNAYTQNIPKEGVPDSSKGETGTFEHNNGRPRHWFARFRRKSLVVAKAFHTVELTIALK
jgi:Transposase and inactivated derivatives, IS1 family